MPQDGQIIHIHSQAPAKPLPDAPCNGCGVCCLVEPCPLGMLLSGSRKGACKAVRWEPSSNLYRCGALVAPAEVLRTALGPLLPKPLAPLLRWLAHRWISAGSGCDCKLDPHD